jgi:hypothetical protein
LSMIERGATHIGVATDHVVESFRNDLYPGYKTSEGVAPELLSQFPVLEEALEAMVFTGKAPCSALSSWRLTTSGSAFANQAKRLSSRLLMLLMLKVATLTKSLSVPVLSGCLPTRNKRVRCSGSDKCTGGKKRKTEPKRWLVQRKCTSVRLSAKPILDGLLSCLLQFCV